MEIFNELIQQASEVLTNGGTILYPTDTIWGIGCDATNESAIRKVYQLKKREEKKSMIILIASIEEIEFYVSNPSKKILAYLSIQAKPTTAIFQNAINLPELLSNDGTVAIRIVNDNFCRKLIEKCGVPLVSTSANISGEKFPGNFDEITDEIKKGVDYVVQHRKNDLNIYQPSSIIKLNDAGEIEKIR